MKKKDAKKKGYITSYELAKSTGLERLAITRIASKIPGGIKLEDTGHWFFPKTAIKWIVNRTKIQLRT